VSAALQFGHGAVTPIWARVAEMCWPQLAHANLTSGACAGRGNVEVFGTVTAALQFGHGAVTPIWAAIAERCCPQVGHANLSSIAIIFYVLSSTKFHFDLRIG
jgi:hypothetical protein